MLLAAFQHHYIGLEMSHSQGERGKIHRALTLIGGFMSSTEGDRARPPLTAPNEPPDTASLLRVPAAQL